MATKIDGSIFQPCFLAILDKPDLFNRLIDYAQAFKSNPDNMELRRQIKGFCSDFNLPYPNYPENRSSVNEKNENPFIPLHLALENENFKEWFSNQRVIWHTHNNIQEWHVNCQCRKCQKTHLHCPLIRLSAADVSRIINGSISSRGRFFVFNHRLNKCSETKIEIHKDRFRFVQNAFRFGFIFTPTDIQVERKT